MTVNENKNGLGKAWSIIIPCLVGAVTLGYSVGLTIGTYAAVPFITQGAQIQIDLLRVQVNESRTELKEFRVIIEDQSKLLSLAIIKLELHIKDKP